MVESKADYEYRKSDGVLMRRGKTLQVEVLHLSGNWVPYAGREAYMDWHTASAADAYEYGIHDGVYFRMSLATEPEVLGPKGWTVYSGKHGYRDWFERRTVTAEEVRQAEAMFLGNQS